MRFRVLGPLELRDGHGGLVRLGAPKQRTLLGLLLLHANQPVSGQRLAEALWGQDPPASAGGLLRTYLSWLRRTLGLTGHDGAPQVDAEPGGYGYRLTVAVDQLDLLLFEQAAADGQRAWAAGELALAAGRLADAVGLWRGRAFEDVGLDGAAAAELAGLQERRLGAVERWVQARLGLGQHAGLLDRLAGLVAEEPLREGLWRCWMLALYRSGRAGEALAAFATLRARLVEELGTEPGPGLQRLHRQILSGDPALDLPAGPAGSAAPAAVRPTAPERAVDRAVLGPRQLPADIATFTGRERELAQLDDVLAATGQDLTSVAVVCGSGGVGKTALAVRWSHRVADRFPDGQLYVDLRGYAVAPPLRPIEALATLLRLLGTPPEQVPVEEAEAAGLYRSLLAGRRMLVVLDNAHDAAQVRPLLPGSGASVVLVTSRDQLTGLVATHGARQLTLGVLSPGDAVTLLQRILGAGRAAGEPQAVEELARACAYLPLALRIAAANLTARPDQRVASYVGKLATEDRLAALEVRGDPQTAVRAAFDLSYARLTADARRAFRLLGLVAGPDISLAAAAALAGAAPERAECTLEQLSGVHLVEQRALRRYGLHDLLRVYAGQRCAREDGEPERRRAVERLLGWYLRAADAAATLLYPQVLRLPAPPAAAGSPAVGFDDLPGAMAWLEAERANLVPAVRQAADLGHWPLAWRLADSLRGYFWLRRHTVDWLTVARAALASAEHAADPQAQAAAQLNLGDVHQVVGRFQQAVECYTAALALARQAGWGEGQACVLGRLGKIHLLLGQLQQAADAYTQALALNRRTGRVGGEAAYLGQLGAVYQELGLLQQAADHHAQALALYRKLGSIGGEATATGNIGMVDHDLGLLEDAHEHLTRALTLHREVGDRYGEADTLDALAAVHRDAGRHGEALRTALAAVALAGEIGDRRIEPQALNTVGSVHLCAGDPRQAGEHHERALGLAHQAGATTLEAGALLGLAAANLRAGRPALAHAAAQEALALARQAGLRVLEGHAHTTLARIHLEADRLDQASRHARQAAAIQRQTGHRLGRARALALLGHTLRRSDGTAAALPQWREALQLFTSIGSPDAEDLRVLVESAAPA